MTKAQQIFCNEYLIDLNATRAYKVAYKRCKKDTTANVNASKLLRNTNVKTYIDTQMQEREKRTQITQDRVLKELATIAFFDIRNLYDEKGELKKVNLLDEDVARAIASIKVLQKSGGMKISSGNTLAIEHIPEQTVEIKLNDKKGALELIGRHLGMFKDSLDINVKEKEEKKNAIMDIVKQMQTVDGS